MSANIPLLRKVVEWVEEQEQLTEAREWNQAVFFRRWEPVDYQAWCETIFCVAGKVVLDDGWVPHFKPSGIYSHLIRDGETRYDVFTLAADLLGLSETEAFDLFTVTYDQGAAGVRRVAEEIAGERL